MERPKGRVRRWVENYASVSIGQLHQVFSSWLMLPGEFGGRKRIRLFPPSVTFWIFLSQVLDENGSCREALRKFQAWSLVGGGRPSSQSTAAYCKARAKLRVSELVAASNRVTEKMEQCRDWLWCGRRVMVVDGSGLSMPDSKENQEAWPHSAKSKPGCAFPVMRIVGFFSLATGALLDLTFGPLTTGEITLFHRLRHWLRKGDVLLADRGFGSLAYYYVLSRKGVDCVMRKNARRINSSVIKRINKNDRIVTWRKSGVCPKWLDLKTWKAIPEALVVREVVVRVNKTGFRTETILVATTLLDSQIYSAHDIALLYLRRWRVELYLRDIKTTMGMDILRCKTPAMVKIELWMYIIAYNLIRAVMMEAAISHGVSFERISCKGTISTIRQWAPVMAFPGLTSVDRHILYDGLLHYIAYDTLPVRPNRSEPRARKRRPKTYQLLMKPRSDFKEIAHRNRYRKP